MVKRGCYYFFFAKRLFKVKYSMPQKIAQSNMPTNGLTAEDSMAPMEPKNPKKLTAHKRVFSILIATVQVKNAIIAQMAVIILSLM